MNCEACKEKDKQVEPVPFQSHQADMARLDRANRRLWILLIILLAMLLLTNAGWIWYESQWVDESVVQEVDTGEGDAFVAGIGDVTYGEGKTDG